MKEIHNNQYRAGICMLDNIKKSCCNNFKKKEWLDRNSREYYVAFIIQ